MGLHRVQRRRIIPQSLPVPIQLVVEVLLVLCLSIGTAALLPALTTADQSARGQTGTLLAAATAGTAAVVAVLCALNARLRGEPGLRLASYAWAYYALVVMPLSVVETATGVRSPVPGSSVTVTAVFLVLLALGFSRTYPHWLSGPRAIVGGGLLAALAIAGAAVLPASVTVALDSTVTDAVLLAAWCLLACIVIAHGLRSASPVSWRVGSAVALLAAAHTLLLAGGTVLEFALLRLVGFLVLLAALCLHTRTLMRERRAAQTQAAEQAAAAERAESRRRHEVRNTLTTLSAVTTLMAPRPEADAATNGSITAMVDAELGRLRGLLENTAAEQADTASVDSVLTRLVTLRRAAGETITLDCPPGLVAALPAANLAQVVTNLLANCARHAAGAEIHVAARRQRRDCVVEVTDAGPGLGAGAGSTPTAGDGLGLALSTQLVEAAGGSLQLRAATRFATGTTAMVRLPLVEQEQQFAAPRIHRKAAS